MTGDLIRAAFLGVMLAATAMAEQPAASTAIAPTDSYEKYRAVTERNIFLKNRTRAVEERTHEAPASERTTPAPEPGSDEACLVLTGVVSQGDDWVAFIEDTRTGQTTRMRAGRTLGGGTLASIAITGIDYYREGDHKAVAVGQNLAGLTPALPSAIPTSPTTTTSTTTTTTSSATTATSTPSATITVPVTSAASGSTQMQPASVPAAGGSNDVLERLRRRRAEEMNR
jgi:hypothetical protein